MDIAFIPFEFWAVAFVFGLAIQNVWIALGIGFVITHGMLWMSDHANDPLDLALIYHVWFLVMQFAGALSGVVTATSLALPRMAYLSNTSRGKWTRRTTWVFVMCISMLLVAIGLNLALCRACIGGGGMSPIGLSESTSRIVGWTCFGVGAFFTLLSFIAMYQLKDARGSITAKYSVLSTVFLTFPLWVHDALLNSPSVAKAVPGIIFLIAFVFGVLLFALTIYWISASPNTNGMDKYYKNMQLVRRLTLAVGLIIFIGALIVLIVIWALDYTRIDATLITCGAYSVVVIIAVIIYGMVNGREYSKLDCNAPLPHHMTVQGQLEMRNKLY